MRHMDVHRIKGVEIKGVVACVPSNVVRNRDACLELYGEKGVETLIKATGIEARAVAEDGTSTQDLCVTAAAELLEKTARNEVIVEAQKDLVRRKDGTSYWMKYVEYVEFGEASKSNDHDGKDGKNGK